MPKFSGFLKSFSLFFISSTPQLPPKDDEWFEISPEDYNLPSSDTQNLTHLLEQLNTSYENALITAGQHPIKTLSNALTNSNQPPHSQLQLSHMLINCYTQIAGQLGPLSKSDLKLETQAIGPSLSSQLEQLKHYYTTVMGHDSTPEHLIKAFKLAATLTMFKQKNQQFRYHITSYSAHSQSLKS